MFQINELLGRVITIRSIAGNEFVAKLLAWNSEKAVLTVQRPMTVALDQDQVVLVPFAVTSSQDQVHFPGRELIVMATDESVANLYLEVTAT